MVDHLVAADLLRPVLRAYEPPPIPIHISYPAGRHLPQTTRLFVFLTLILDNKHRLIGLEEVSVGTLTNTLVHPREVFKVLILANAAAFAVAHNHPSGDPTPSKEDIEITHRLREAADLFGIRLLDHIVIGRGRYVSFVDDGYW